MILLIWSPIFSAEIVEEKEDQGFMRMIVLVMLSAIVILVASIILISKYRFQQMVRRETNTILATIDHTSQKIVKENDIKELPNPVKNWLIHSGMVGKPYINVAKVIQHAEMRMSPDQLDWKSARASQYTTTDVPAFIWTVEMKMNPLLRVKGRDMYKDGKGEMLIKLNSVINVVDQHGEKLTEGTLQRYLGEMVWYPSLALSEYISWEQINETSARATMEYQGSSGSGTFYFNSEGDFTRFVAYRYKDADENATRYPWVLDVEAYSVFEGIRVPSKMTATWKLQDQDWTWLKLEVVDIQYNEPFGL